MIFFFDASGLILTSTSMFLSREQITNGSETWWRIPIRTGDGMCFALSVWNVNQPAPRRAKSAMLPENASHAFTRGANPSHPISCRKPNCIFTISSPRLASPVYVFFFLLSKQSHKHLPCPDCVGKGWGWWCGGTHLLVPVGPSCCWDAGCLLSCSGLWGHSGQQVCAKVWYKKEKGVKMFTIQANSLKNAVCTVSLASSTLMQPGSWGYRLENMEHQADHSLRLCCWGASLI